MLNDTRGTRNCGLCSLAGLSDADKLSVFLLEHGDNDKLWDSHEEGMYDDDIERHLKELRLVSSRTPAPGIFPPHRSDKQSTTQRRIPSRRTSPGQMC